MSMRAVVYDRPREFAIREVPVGDPGAGEVRIRVLLSGVCGTDLHIHEGGFIADYPLTPGHETVGIVDAVGAAIDGLSVGEHVVINPNLTCGRCEHCRAGQPRFCPSFGGLGTLLPGGFAEYLVAPQAQVFSAEGLSPDVAVFAEPAACAVHGIEVLKPRPGTSALVVGTGATGLLLAQLIAHAGAARVTVASIAADQLATATALGLDATYLMDRDRLADDITALKALSGKGFDYVVDATGVARVQEATIALARPGATILWYGVANERDRVSVSPYDVFRRELTITGSFSEIDTVPAALAMLRAGRIRTDGLITHRFPLERYGEALDAVRTDPTAHKVMLVP